MRRADPHEHDELERMLNTLIHAKECIRSFKDGEINLRDAVCQMAAVFSAGRATPLSGKVGD
jgi:hypothetical protein